MKNSLKIIIFFAISCLCILSFINPVFAEYQAPKPYNFVNDYSNIISDNTESQLNSLLNEVKSKTNAEIAVVTLNSLDGYPIEDVGLAIGRQWGIGQKGKNSGVLLIVAPNDRKMRIEVGYGLEGAIPDSKAGRIRDELILPEFKKGNYEAGIVFGTDAITKLVAKEYGVQITGEYKLPKQSEGSSDFGSLLLFLAIIFVLFRRSNRGSRHSDLLPFGIGYGLGSFGGGSSGGGFGGFGGGGFGGGGASGGW